MVRVVASLLAIFWGLAASSCSSPGEPAACDRDCLVSFADAWLDALAAHDPDRLALAGNIRFVENVTRMPIGEGLWSSAAGSATDFRIYVADTIAGTIGVMTVLERRTQQGVVPAQLALRLLIEDRRIVEAEHIVADIGAEADASRLLEPRAGLTAVVPAARRLPRSQLIEIANSYYESLDRSDGALAPFAQDCERQENGMITAGPGLPPASFASVDVNGRSPPPVARDCIGQMSSRRFAYIDSIDNRRIFADPQLGLAMGFSHFRQSMSRGPHLMIAADGSELMWDEQREPYDLPAAHIFRITDGEIHEVEAIGIFVPYAAATGWE